MQRSPKKSARSPNSKASKPDLKPLDEHLAGLLSPGLSEAPQSGFDSGAAEMDPNLARKLGLTEIARPSDPVRRVRTARPDKAITGAGITNNALQELLERGDPNLREAKPWVPHRPERPEKSEGGIRFKIQSEYRAEGRSAAGYRGAGYGY